MTISHSGIDPANSFLMERFEAIVAFQKAVIQSRCGYTASCVAYWWKTGQKHHLDRFQNLAEACAILEESIGLDDIYWTLDREDHSDL